MAHPLLTRALAEGRTTLLEDEAKVILRDAGLPVPPLAVAATPEEAAEAARRLGGPVVVKVLSPAALHKSDVGGVALNLRTPAEAGQACQAILEKVRPLDAGARVTVQPMLPPGVECIIGMTTDAQFGPVMMFGLGGVFTEVLRDVAFRLLPLRPADAAEMLEDIQARRLLEGYRNSPPADKEALARVLLGLSRFCAENPAVAEVDLNPVISSPAGTAVADARIILRP